MARTKLPPLAPSTTPSRKPSTSSPTSNARSITIRDEGPILENTAITSREGPNTPRGSTNSREEQRGPYPTPVSSAQQPSKGQKNVKPEDESNVKMLVKYGRWSDSGRSWFPNRRSVPGDRPPPQGAHYSYRPVYFNEQPRSPTPPERYSSVASSVESEPIIARPSRRRIHQHLEAIEEQIDEDARDPGPRAEKISDQSSLDSNPIIIRNRRPPPSPIRSSTPIITTVRSYLTHQTRAPPPREPTLANNLHKAVQHRRRNRTLQRRPDPRSRESSPTPPIATRTRRPRVTTPAPPPAAPPRSRPRTTTGELSDSEAQETTAPERSPGPQSGEEDLSEPPESESSESPPPPRRDNNRPPGPVRRQQAWVRRSRRKRHGAGAGDLAPSPSSGEQGRMTLEEWVDEENVLGLSPPYVSSGSEYQDGDGDGGG